MRSIEWLCWLYYLGGPLTQKSIDTFCVAFRIFVVDERRDFRFSTQVEYS